MFNIGQQQIFRPSEEEEEGENENEVQGSAKEDSKGRSRLGSSREVMTMKDAPQDAAASGGLVVTKDYAPATSRSSPVQTCTYTSSSQVAPATPETRNSKKRLLPPLGNTPEELIQTKLPRPRPERRISRNNKVSTIPTVDQ